MSKMEKTTTSNMQGFTLIVSTDDSGRVYSKTDVSICGRAFELDIEILAGMMGHKEVKVRFSPEQFQTFVDSCNDLIAVSKGDFPFKPNWAYTATRKSDGSIFFILGVSDDKKLVLTGGLLPTVQDISLFENFVPAHELQRNELMERNAHYIRVGWIKIK